MTKKIIPVLWIAILFAVSTPGQAGEQNPTPNYFPAVKQELARLETPPRCNDTTMSCSWETRFGADGPAVEVVVRYSPATDTVYAFIDKFIPFPDGQKPTPELALKLLELNAEMVTAKFEWNTGANAVQLSTVISTDSNFDRRAFRSQLTGLLKVAEKLFAELNQ
jgi:hypothetical protein